MSVRTVWGLLLVTGGLLSPYCQAPCHALPLSLANTGDTKGDESDYVSEDIRALATRGNESPWMLLDNSLPLDDDLQLKPRSVTKADFEQLLRSARTYHDVLRIFYDDLHLKDDDIDRLVTSQHSKQRWTKGGNTHHHDDLLNDTPSVHNHSPFEKMDLAVEHVMEMEMQGDKACVPQPRLIYVRDLNLTANRAYYPHCTLVYRCPELDCCQQQDMHCVPLTTSTITRHFLTLAMTVPPSSGSSPDHQGALLHLLPEGLDTLPLNFTNHTSCHCQLNRLKHLPKCLPCPRPFEQSRLKENMECQCRCPTRHKHCQQVYKGNMPLLDEELGCIKANKCARPTCLHGHFDDNSVASGYCPQQPAVTLVTNTSSTLRDHDHDSDEDNDDGSDSGINFSESLNEVHDDDSSGSLDSYEDNEILPNT